MLVAVFQGTSTEAVGVGAGDEVAAELCGDLDVPANTPKSVDFILLTGQISS